MVTLASKKNVEDIFVKSSNATHIVCKCKMALESHCAVKQPSEIIVN